MLGFPGGSVTKIPLASAGNTKDVGLISGSGRSSGEGNGNPQAWQVTVCGVAK